MTAFLNKTFAGNPCKHGHSGLRYSRNGMCVECQKTYNENREYHRVKLKERYARNSAAHIADCSARRQRKSAAKRASRDAFRTEHSAVLAAAQNAIKDLHRILVVQRVDDWREANPHKLRAQRTKGNFVRRSAVRGRIMEPVTAEFLTEQRTLQGDKCAYCFVALFGGGHQDHVVPVAHGGAHSPSNIVWACEPCNLRKGARLGWVPFGGCK